MKKAPTSARRERKCRGTSEQNSGPWALVGFVVLAAAPTSLSFSSHQIRSHSSVTRFGPPKSCIVCFSRSTGLSYFSQTQVQKRGENGKWRARHGPAAALLLAAAHLLVIPRSFASVACIWARAFVAVPAVMLTFEFAASLLKRRNDVRGPGESLRFVGKEGAKLIWDESAPALFAVILEAHCLEQALSRLGPSWNSSSCRQR